MKNALLAPVCIGMSRCHFIKNGHKGQNPLLSHVFAIGLSLVIVGVVIYVTSSLNSQYTTFVATQDVQQVCSIIRSAATKANLPSEYISLNDTTKAAITINLPGKIANEPYRIRFIGSNASIETPSSNVTCVIGYNATYIGSVPGGRVTMSWVFTKSGINTLQVSGA